MLLLVGLPIVLATAIIQRGMPELRGEYRDEVDPVELEGRTPEEVHFVPETHPLHHERLFTWRNAILGGVGAAGLLVAAVITYLAMWATGIGPVGSLVAQGVIEEGDPVILADFTNSTPDSTLGGVVTSALRADLVQSPVLRIVERASLEDVLRRMQRDPSTRLSPDVAREAAQRDGITAVLEGDVGSVGDGYILTATIRSAESGQALAAFRVTAPGPDGLISAIDELSRNIREKAGESLRNIRAGVPLEQVTTGSLDALRLYSESEDAFVRGDYPTTISLLDQAVAVDSTFAMAWRLLAVAYSNTGLDPGKMVEAATQAYRHRDRLTEIERYLAEAFYNDQVTGDQAATRQAYENILRLDPDNPHALNNLANIYQANDDLEQGNGAVRSGDLRARCLQRGVPEPREDPGGCRTGGLRSGRGGRVSHAVSRRRCGGPGARMAPAGAREVRRGRRRSASHRVGRLTGRHRSIRGVSGPSLVAVARGDLDEGRRLMSESVRTGPRPVPRMPGSRRTGQRGRRFPWDEHRRDRVHREMDPGWPVRGAVTAGPQPFLPALNLALAGDVAGARAVNEDFRASVPEAQRSAAAVRQARFVDALIRARGSDTVGVAAEMQAVQDDEGCWTCYRTEIALAHEWMHRPERAIELHESVLEHPYTFVELNPAYGTVAMLHLGPLYEEVGDTAKAVEAYRRVVDRWSGGGRGGPEVRGAGAGAVGGAGGRVGDGRRPEHTPLDRHLRATDSRDASERAHERREEPETGPRPEVHAPRACRRPGGAGRRRRFPPPPGPHRRSCGSPGGRDAHRGGGRPGPGEGAAAGARPLRAAAVGGGGGRARRGGVGAAASAPGVDRTRRAGEAPRGCLAVPG